MKRLLPQSLLGQVMVAVMLALLIAQVVSVTLLYRAGEERRLGNAITAAAFSLINGAERAARFDGGQRDDRREGRRILRRGGDGGPIDRLPFPLRYSLTDRSPIVPLPSEGDREERLRALLAQEGITPHAVAITVRRAGEDAMVMRLVADRPRFQRNTAWQDRRLLVATIQRVPDGPWETARILEPPRPEGALGVLLFQTLVTFGFLTVMLFLVLRRITRPLGALTERVSHFSRQPESAEPLEPSGPADVRRLIEAYNAMETRLSGMIDEKDVMLGAIGHDLKTPLAALRVRIESVPDDAQRAKMADSIEDITATLDDILSLARVGKPGDPLEKTNLAELVASVVEEYQDRGEPVELEHARKVVGEFRSVWIQRALRNLIDNALRYGGAARVSLKDLGETCAISVTDDGPGIPEDQISAMFQPFHRGEASRNRATGGAGLGLTLARAIAEHDGGSLELSNRLSGSGEIEGLEAVLHLPLGD